MIVRDLATPRRTPYWVAEVDGRVVAYLGGWLSWLDFHVASIATAPPWRRRGLAELLLLRALRFAARRGAECARLEYRVSNEAAARLYAKLGFTPVRLRRGYYADTGEDAWEVVLEGLADPQAQARLRQLERTWRQRHH